MNKNNSNSPNASHQPLETLYNRPRNESVTVTDEQLQKLREIGCCTLCHGLVDLGYYNTYLRDIRPLATGEGGDATFAGRARTLRFAPLREDLVVAQYEANTRSPHRVTIETVEANEVVVADAGGSLESGVFGDIFTLRVKQRGGRAIVIDGAIRDLKGIRKVELPVFAKGIHGAGIPRAQISVGVNEPVRCGGVIVLPGDVVVGDEDGIVVSPPELVEELIRVYHPKIDFERWVRKKLRAGEDLHHYYQFPPREEVVREYEASRNGQSS